MSAVEIGYGGGVIATLDGTGSKTLKTAGTYCEKDIVVAYAPHVDKPIRRWDVTVTGESREGRTYFLQDDWLKSHREDVGLIVAIIPKFTIVYDSTKSQSGVFLGMNNTWATIHSAAYKTLSAYVNKNGAITPRSRTFGLTDSSDVGDVGITTEGWLNVVATASVPLAPGEYCIVAWLM